MVPPRKSTKQILKDATGKSQVESDGNDDRLSLCSLSSKNAPRMRGELYVPMAQENRSIGLRSLCYSLDASS